MLLKGSKIANDNVVAAGSIIAWKTTTSNVIIGSNEKILKQNIHWKY